MRRILPGILLLCLCTLGLPTLADTVTVHIYTFGFSINPKGGAVVDPVIYVGDTIHWVFDDGGHNTASDAGQKETWSSGNKNKGATFDHLFANAGIFKYTCTLHKSSMKANVVVLDPSLVITNLTLAPASVNGGTSSVGTVTLKGPAGASGTVVNLKSSDTTIATVPASVTVASGKTTQSFTVTTKTVTADKTVAISAQIGTSAAVATNLTVTPDPALIISTLTLAPTTVKGGVSSVGTVTLKGAAGASGTVVNLKSSDTAVGTVPASVTVASGKTTQTFTITTKTVTADKTITISAQIGTSAAVAVDLKVTTDPALTISTLTLAPTSVKGGVSSIGTVTLKGAAAAGGVVVNLKSSDTTLATVAASVTVGTGKTIKTFTINTKAVTATKTVTISAQIGTGAVVSAILTLTK
ncbi:MAG: hypothetical protein NT023_09205 [Armatimonadetes bacterium]|nr:hypothetical protein [Armatimonadota bacterium]